MLISVVVPVGRVDQPLVIQLRSLVSQEIDDPFEIVLACNSSDGATFDRLDEVVSGVADSRVRAVPASDRRGPSHARNVGAREAKGDLLAFCDGDDIAHSSWLAEIARSLQTWDAVGGRLVGFGLNERQSRARPEATPGSLPSFMGVPYIVSANLGVHRLAFEAVDGFDEGLETCEDIAFSWSLVARGHQIGFAPAAVISYRHRPGVLPMVSQHYRYGRGMSQVLMRYGIPDDHAWTKPEGMELLRPNGQPVGRRSALGVLRRGALGVGRLGGIIGERATSRRKAP